MKTLLKFYIIMLKNLKTPMNNIQDLVRKYLYNYFSLEICGGIGVINHLSCLVIYVKLWLWFRRLKEVVNSLIKCLRMFH